MSILALTKDYDFAEAMRNALCLEEHQIMIAENIKEARALFKEQQPVIVFYDLSLPGSAEFANEIKPIPADLYETVAVINKDTDAEIEEAFETGATFVIRKATSLIEIKNITKRILERKTCKSSRNASEKKLKESENSYRTTIELLNEFICRFKPDGILTFVNGAFCRYVDKTREELVGCKLIPLMPDKDAKSLMAKINSLSSDTPTLTHEHRAIMPDGSIRWNTWTNLAIFDEEGNVVEFQSIGRDITEEKNSRAKLIEYRNNLEKLVEDRTKRLDEEIVKHKRTEEELEYQLSLAQALVDNIPTPVYFKTIDGVYINCNKSFEEYAGKKREEIIGKKTHEIFDKESADLHTENERILLNSKEKVKQYELMLQHHDKTQRHIMIRKAILPASKHKSAVIIGVALDITERKQIENSLEETISQANIMAAEAIVANQAKSEFLANMSHEIRTPMNGVIGMSELLWETNLDNEQRELTESIRASGEALMAIIKVLLRFVPQ